jgi:hypothetical protein
MLRPKKGVGERPSKKATQLTQKGPLLIAVALFAAYPVCLAEAASATSLPSQQAQGSSFVRPSSTYERSGWLQAQSSSTSPQRNLPRTSPSSPLLPYSIPSLEDIDTLESTLSTLQNQLAELKTKNIKPERIQQLETRIQDLKDTILLAKQARTTYLKAQATLKTLLTSKNETELRYNDLTKAKTTAETTLTAKQLTLQEQEAIKTQAQTALDVSEQNLTTARTNKTTSDAALTSQATVKSQAEATLTLRQAEYSTASANLDSAEQTLNEASSELTAAEAQLDAANQTLDEKQQAVDAAQSDYDNNLIPDPTWTVPTEQVQHTRLVENTRQVATTTLVPHTTYTTQGGILAEVYNRNGYNQAPPLPYQGEAPISSQVVSNIDFNWGGGVVLNSGRAEDVIVKFTGNLLFPQDGYYRFYTPADDGTKLNIAGMSVIDDWYDKGGGGTVSEEVFIRGGVLYPFTLYYYENGGGASVSMYYYTPTNGFQVVPSSYLGTTVQETTTYTEETTYTTETYYTEEIYYTTEPVQFIEKTIQVDIGEGGEATFNAPEGSTFIRANLRYESYNDPTCGASFTEIAPAGITSLTIRANNDVFGDPCGGQVKHVVGTLTYKGAPTAPLIKDPAKLVTLNEAKSERDAALATRTEALATYNEKLETKNSASADLELIQASFNEALSNKDDAEDDVTLATSELNRLTTLNEEAQNELDAAIQANNLRTQELQTANESVTTVSSEVVAAEETLTEVTSQHDVAEASLKTVSFEVEEAQEAEITSATTFAETYQTATAKVSTTKEDIATAPEDTIPEPPVEEGSKEIPAVLTAENLMEVNLEAVDPTELTEEQAAQLVEAALEAFETATEGSPEYQQALDALYLAAEQDDIELSPELAAIPGLAGAVEVLNFLGNAGADMSPKVREESEKVVVATVVAAGAAIQSAAAAAATASAPSGGSRRIGK